jgi:hypothetical protein
MRPALRLIAVIAFASSALIGGTARAEIHALIVGIDDYLHEQKLQGAVADANDIEAALKGLRPKSTKVLRNADASRARLEQEWNALIARSQPGDTIIFTFAGHGGSEPWRNPQGRAETAESFLFPRFRTPRPAQDSAERLLGRQFKSWFKAAGEAKGGKLRIIFVADSCHAGGMMRSLDASAGVTYRSAGLYEIPDSPIVIAPREEAAPADLAHVTFIAATQADKKIPEVVIDGKKRGALSYAFARALEGYADRQGRGQLSNLDLQAFITTTVRQYSEAQQTPEIQYRSGGENDAVLVNVPARRDLSPDTTKSLALRIDYAEVAVRTALQNNLIGARIVEADTADLIWNAKSETVLSGVGDVVAEGIKAKSLQGVVDKWRVLPAIKEMIQKAPFDVRLAPDDSRHVEDKAVSFRIKSVPLKFLTVFNLAGDGTVQFLYPRSGDPPHGEQDTGKPFSIDFRVNKPFGADHAIFISSAASLHVLHGKLRAAPPAIDLPNLLGEAFAGGNHAIGMQSLYTTSKTSKQP